MGYTVRKSDMWGHRWATPRWAEEPVGDTGLDWVYGWDGVSTVIRDVGVRHR